MAVNILSDSPKTLVKAGITDTSMLMISSGPTIRWMLGRWDSDPDLVMEVASVPKDLLVKIAVRSRNNRS